MSKKILDLNLIENIKKKKKNKNYDLEIQIVLEELYNSIDNLIFLNNNGNCKINESQKFIKKNLLKFIELYININRNLINLNSKNKIVREILNTLLDDIIEKCINTKNDEIVKIIELNKEKIKIEKFKNINMII
tara:strand:- start:122 stop:523 length:402 start_codon:yes stop_codon:yes gene_type:complete